ncbi:hypothetical protein GGR58DRAFT_503721 [Xylaria digitata]|nr:hypothetical protein GGR58DRAFT_503721 [Xylaria digitata]
MQSTVLLALISTALFGSFPAAVLAAPAEMGARLAQPDSDSPLEARQYYDGPCSHTDCGVNRINCRDRRLWRQNELPLAKEGAEGLRLRLVEMERDGKDERVLEARHLKRVELGSRTPHMMLGCVEEPSGGLRSTRQRDQHYSLLTWEELKGSKGQKW